MNNILIDLIEIDYYYQISLKIIHTKKTKTYFLIYIYNHLPTVNSNFTFIAANSLTKYLKTNGIAIFEHFDYLHFTQ